KNAVRGLRHVHYHGILVERAEYIEPLDTVDRGDARETALPFPRETLEVRRAGERPAEVRRRVGKPRDDGALVRENVDAAVGPEFERREQREQRRELHGLDDDAAKTAVAPIPAPAHRYAGFVVVHRKKRRTDIETDIRLVPVHREIAAFGKHP